MHVVVTGFDARAARPAAGHARHSLGYLITTILEHYGHQVTQTTDWPHEWETAEIYGSADRILVGLGSPLALTSTYAYPAMLALSEYWEDSRLRLFCDDPDTGKIIHGASSAVRRYQTADPLFSNKSFRNRRFFEEASDQHHEMYAACERLLFPGDWPRTYFPVQGRWASPRTTQIGKTAYYGTPIDPTTVLWELLPVMRTSNQERRSPTWLVEPLHAESANRMTTRGIKMTLNVKPSLQRLYGYPNAIGVLEAPPLRSGVPGWWTPAATIAAFTRTYFHTPVDPQSDPNLAKSAYYVLPSSFEQHTATDRTAIVDYQAVELLRAPTIDEFVKEILL